MHSGSAIPQYVSFWGKSFTSIDASYVDLGTTTSLRQLNLTINGVVTSIPPTANASLDNTTTVTKAITGQFAGLYADSKTNALYIMQRFYPIFSMPSGNFVQNIGSTTTV